MFIASPSCRGYLLDLTGMIDLALAIILISGGVMTGQFLPHAYGPCNGASNWNNGTDGSNFFIIANVTGDFETDGPQSVCHIIVQNWILAIVVMCVLFTWLCCVFRINLADSCRSPTSFT